MFPVFFVVNVALWVIQHYEETTYVRLPGCLCEKFVGGVELLLTNKSVEANEG